MARRRPGRVARFVGYLVGLALLAGGLVTTVAGVRFGLTHDAPEDIWAAAFLGGMLLIAGAAALVAVGRTARGTPPAADDPAAGALAGTAYYTAGHVLDGSSTGPADGDPGGNVPD